MPFITELVVEALPVDPDTRVWYKPWTWFSKPKQKWVLKENLVYEGHTDTFVVPEGFTTDFASVPRVFWGIIAPTGQHTKAAVLHDWLYSSHATSRQDADGIFRRVMKELGVNKVRRNVMWAGVRLFGSGPYNAD